MCKISVVMTTYNGCDYLHTQMESIRNQTVKPDEVIIIDDASTDGKTPQTIQKYINHHYLDNWRLIQNTVNLGWEKNFIKAMDMAMGDIVFLADQDDVWFKTKIEHMVECMKNKDDISVLAASAHIFTDPKDIIEGDCSLDKNKLEKVAFIEKNLRNQRPGCTICYRNDFYKNNKNLLLYGWPHDAFLWLIALINDELYVLNQDEINYRRHEKSVTTKKDFSLLKRNNRNKQFIEQLRLIINQLDGNMVAILENYMNKLKVRQCALEKRSIILLIGLYLKTDYYSSIKTLAGDILSVMGGGERHKSWWGILIKSKRLRHKILECMYFVPDSIMVRIQYRLLTHRKLHLKEPKRFSEKIQWYKVYYRDPLMAQCVDKGDVRDYVKKCGLGKYLNECYGIYSDISNIDIESLPNKFVIKDTLGGGGNSVIICNDKRNIDFDIIKEKMQFWLDIDWKHADNGREWVYNQKPHRIIIEKLIETDNPNGLTDYKFFCFDGKVEYIYIIDNRKLGQSIQVGIFSRNFKRLQVSLADKNYLDHDIDMPVAFDEMIMVAEKLSACFSEVRVDLYNENGKIIFGELTFFDGSGYFSFEPDSFDFEMGEKWVLPVRNR